MKAVLVQAFIASAIQLNDTSLDMGFLSRSSASESLSLVSHASTHGRYTHRRTTDGRLCASEFTQGGVTYADCTTAPNPDGVGGKEWCYAEPGVAGNPWSYCAPKADYGAVRDAVNIGFGAKGVEMHHAISVVQQLTKKGNAELKRLNDNCQ